MCRFGICSYLVFGPRISMVVKFPWVLVIRLPLQNHLQQPFIRMTFVDTSQDLAEFILQKWYPTPFSSVTSNLLTKHIWKFLGNSSGLRPNVPAAPFFLPAQTPWHCHLRLLHHPCVTMVLLLSFMKPSLFFLV